MRKYIFIILTLTFNLGFSQGLKLFQANPYIGVYSDGDGIYNIVIPVYNDNQHTILTLIDAKCIDGSGGTCSTGASGDLAPGSIGYTEVRVNNFKSNNTNLSLIVGYSEEGLYKTESINYAITIESQTGFYKKSIIIAPYSKDTYFMSCFGAPYMTYAINGSAIISGDNYDNIEILNNDGLYNNPYENSCVAMHSTMLSNESAILNLTLQNENNNLTTQIRTFIEMFEENK